MPPYPRGPTKAAEFKPVAPHDRPLQGEVTGLLRRWTAGDDSALEQLTPLIYGELRKIARGALKKESQHVPLETTGLVNEAFLRLLKTDIDWHDRRHFFALSARLIRRVLVDLARERKSDKRGYGISPEPSDMSGHVKSVSDVRGRPTHPLHSRTDAEHELFYRASRIQHPSATSSATCGGPT